jgi:serine/threonine protein kinase
VLEKLHRGRLLHRDLTPLNVFVCDGRRLKLGDFGIVALPEPARGVAAHTLNPYMAPSEVLAGGAPKWQARDDVYQVGQLLAMLIKGDAREPRAHGRDPRARVQRSSQGDHAPLHRRAAQALRQRERAHRGAARPPGGARDRSLRR